MVVYKTLIIMIAYVMRKHNSFAGNAEKQRMLSHLAYPARLGYNGKKKEEGMVRMIYTLTMNPALDKTVVIHGLTPGGVNRISSVRVDVGGKGVNVSKCLKALGCDSVAAAFWGGGCGKRGMEFLRDEGIGSLAVLVEGETRTNLKIIDPVRRETTDLNEPGPEVSGDRLRQMMHKLDEALAPGDILVLSGSVAPGIDDRIYGRLTAHFQQQGVRVYLDADGELLRNGVDAAPWLVKPNQEELSRYLGSVLTTVPEVAAGAQALLAKGVREVLVSLGQQGALLVKEGRCLRAEGLSVPVKSTVGAGDSMVAAMACGAERGLPDEERLRLAVAISAASVMCSGTQAPDRSAVEMLAEQVQIQQIG